MSTNFSIKQDFNSLETGFFSNTNAVLYKKLSLYKRNKKGLICDIFVPLLIMILGCGMATLIDDNPGT